MIALALLVALLVSGCCRHDVVAPVGIPLETAVMATVSWFVSSRGWKTRRPRGDSSAEDATFKETRHRVAFLFLRARHLLNAHTGWQDEPNQPTLRTRLAAELESVSHTIDSLVGTANHRGPLYGAPAPAPPAEPYLDIGVLATHVHGDDPDPVTIADAVAASAPDRRQGIVLAALDERRERAITIAWRAAAIDDELWTESGATSTLSATGLRELIDRRLYSVELLQYQVNSGARPDGIGGQFVDRRWVMQDWYGVTLSKRAALLAPGIDTNSFVDDLPHRVMEPPSIPRDGFVKQPDDPEFGPDPHPRIKETEIDHLPARPRLASGINTDPWSIPHGSTSMIIDGPPWFDHPETGQLDWNVWPGTQVLPLRVLTSTDLTANPPTTSTAVMKAEEQPWQTFQSDMSSTHSTTASSRSRTSTPGSPRAGSSPRRRGRCTRARPCATCSTPRARTARPSAGSRRTACGTPRTICSGGSPMERSCARSSDTARCR